MIAIISIIAIIALIVFIFALPGIIRKAEQRKEAQDKESQMLPDDDIDLIFKGIRPENMSIEDFKMYRKEKEAHIKQRAHGQLFFNPNTPTIKKVDGKLKTFKKSSFMKAVK